MGSFNLQVDHCVAQVRGAPAGVPLEVGGITAGARLLAVISFDHTTGQAAGVPVSAFTVADRFITSESQDLADCPLVVIWQTA